MSESILKNLELILKTVKDAKIVKNNAILVFDQDAIEDEAKQLTPPYIAISYPGTTGKDDSTRTGGSGTMVIDIHLFGADKCSKKIKTSKGTVFTAVKVLEEIRQAIRCTKSVDQRKWKFEFEAPAGGSDDSLVYIQRWSTTVLMLD